MQNRNAALLSNLLGQNAQVNLSPGLLNPDNIPQINAPSIMDRLSNQGYGAFTPQAAAPGADLPGALQSFAGMFQSSQDVPMQLPDMVQPTYGAQQVQGALGQNLGMPSAFPNLPDPVAARQSMASQGAASPELYAPQAPQAPQQPGGSIWENPTFQQGLQGFAGMFSDIGAGPGVNVAASLQKHMSEAQQQQEESRKQQAMNELRKRIAANPNISAAELARAIAPVDPVKAAQLMIDSQKAGDLKSPYGKALHDADVIGAQYGIGSPQHKAAMENANRVAQGSSTSLEVDPSTGAITFTQGSGNRGGGGSQIVNGTLVTPPSKGAQSAQQTRQLMSAGRDVALKYTTNPYTGTGSNQKLLNDRLAYDKATGATKIAIGNRLVDAAVAAIVAPDSVALGLASQKIPVNNVTQKSMEHAVKLGWAGGTDLLVDNLPRELQERARSKASKVLQEVSRQQDLMYAQGFPIKVGQEGGQAQPSANLPTPPPTVTNKADYQVWFDSLTPEQQAAVYNSLPE